MRILVITTQYGKGGYGEYCHEITTLLSQLGHNLMVLTGEDQPVIPEEMEIVARQLKRDPNWDSRVPGALQYLVLRNYRRHRNFSVYSEIYERYRPEMIFVWQGTGLSPELLVAVESSEVPVAYSICDYWPMQVYEYDEYWGKPATNPLTRLLKRSIKGLLPVIDNHRPIKRLVKFENIICVSQAVCENLAGSGINAKNSIVIHNGINLDYFRFRPRTLDPTRSEISLLYGGSLVPHKGVHTAIKAMNYIRENKDMPTPSFSIYGEGPASYVKYLKQMVKQLGLEGYVTFYDWQRRSRFRDVLERHDVLLFTSLYQEPLARMMQEAMATGMVVIGTTTGGSKELLIDGVNGMVFEPGNARALADRVEKLCDPDLFERLSKNGVDYAKANCDISVSADRIERYLIDLYMHSRN